MEEEVEIRFFEGQVCMEWIFQKSADLKLVKESDYIQPYAYKNSKF